MKDISLQELLEAGSHFGHQKRRWNPAMKDYIYGERDGVHIFDLVKTRDGLLAACEAVRKIAESGGQILFVGTKRQANEIVKSEAEKAGMPYVSVRWMGGLLTNFGHLSRSVKKLADLKAKRTAGELMKYTKKERLLVDREIAKLEKFFNGVTSLNTLPAAMFVVDTHKEEVAVNEAIKMHIPVIGMVDTNADPDKIDVVIPANDDAVKSIELIVGAVSEAILEGRQVKTSAKDKKTGEEISSGLPEEIVEKIVAPVAEVVEETVEKKAETKSKSKLKISPKAKKTKEEK